MKLVAKGPHAVRETALKRGVNTRWSIVRVRRKLTRGAWKAYG